jgi:hypothetical protein
LVPYTFSSPKPFDRSQAHFAWGVEPGIVRGTQSPGIP